MKNVFTWIAIAASPLSTALRYEDGQFIANWKTPKSPGTCYRATATTTDGSSTTALFRLR